MVRQDFQNSHSVQREVWTDKTDYAKPEHHGLPQYLCMLQDAATKAEAWITCFPSEVFEPQTLAAAANDEVLTAGGTKPFIEAGYFESATGTLAKNVESFLAKHEDRSVILVR